MSQRTTKLKLYFSSFQKLENIIHKKASEQYQIKAFHYAKMLELKENRFKHTIHFHNSKDSEIISKRKRSRLEFILSGVIVAAYMGLEYLFELEGLLPSILLVIVLVMLPSFLEIIQPSLKLEIEKSHEQLKELILSLNNPTT